jgi:hypothetical protein
MRMRHRQAACPSLLYFSTLSQKGTILEKKKVTEHKFVLIFSTTFV